MSTQLDIGYRIEKQSVIIFEVRPDWIDPKKKVENNVIKATFLKKTITRKWIGDEQI
jgi:hypothetical protein